MMNARVSRAALVFGLCLPGAAQAAAPTVWGTGTYLTSRNCNGVAAGENCLGPTNPNLRIQQGVYDGGASTGTNVALDPATGGHIQSVVTFGALDLPVIKSGAWAGADNRNNSNSVGYQGFTYGGTAGTAFGLSANFDFTSSGSPASVTTSLEEPVPEIAGEGFGYLVLSLLDPSLLTGVVTAQDVFDFGFGRACGEAGVIGSASIRLGTLGAGPGAGSLTLGTDCAGNALYLAPGASFVVSMLLQTPSNRGGFFDATHTVTLGLDPTLSEEVRTSLAATLVSAQSLVPEPGSWAMMIAGFGLVGAMQRRWRSVAA